MPLPRLLPRLILAATIGWPGASWALERDATAAPAPQPSPAHAPGRLLVKLVAAVDVAADRVARGASIAAGVAGSRLDELNRRFGLTAIRPLRHADAALDTLAARRAAEAARRHRVTPRRAGGPGPSFASAYVFELDPPPDADLVEIARAYAADPAVAWAQPDWYRELLLLPNDPYLATTGAWGQPFGDLWGLARIGAPAAWDVTRGAGVVVAISDTGIDPTHPDIAANLWTNPGEIPGNGIDDDGNGYVDDVHGWNFVADGPNPTDDHGHGTHVAGTVAAVGGNGAGVVGVAYETRVMAVKGLASQRGGTDGELAEGILYAVENGAQVINASWGGVGEEPPALRDALDVAAAAGVVFVAAAGNSGTEVDYMPLVRVDPPGRTYPAAFRNVIAVGASDHLDQKASFSNWGVKIDVLAPGGGDAPPPSRFPERSILSLRAAQAGAGMTGDGALVVDDAYVRQAGTSMAAPHVTGVAALVLARHPELAPEQVRQALRHGADDVGAVGFDLLSGHGRLDAAGALAVGVPPVAHIASPMNHRAFTDAIAVSGSAAGPGFASYTLEYGVGSAPATWTVAVGPVATEVVDGPLGTVPVDAVPDGELSVRLRVVDGDGAAFEDRVLVFLDRVDVTAPLDNSRWRDETLAVTGTIAPPDLVGYTVAWRDVDAGGTWRTDGVALTGGGTQPVGDGELATVDLAALPDPVRFELRVAVTTAGGTAEHLIRNQIRDTSVRAGWPRHFVSDPVVRHGVRGDGTPTLVDLDGDGVTEILVGVGRYNVPEELHVLEPDGSTRAGWPQPVPGLDSGPSAADLDGDGRLEVVVAGDDHVYVFHDDGTPLAGWPRPFPDVRDVDCALADMDGDGSPEIVFRSGSWATGGAFVNVVRADGSALPGYPVRIDAAKPTLAGPILAVGDVDGDGRPDVAAVRLEFLKGGWPWYAGGYLVPQASTARATLLVLDDQGRMKPGWPKKIGKEIVSGPWNKHVWPVPLVADLDGDDVGDVAVASDKLGRVLAFRGDGKRLGGKIALTLPKTRRVKKDDRHDPLIAADLTGDGAPELVLSTDAGQDTNYGYPHDAIDWVGVLERTDGRWHARSDWLKEFVYLGSVSKTHGPGSLTVADADGDGAQELLLGLLHCDEWRLGKHCRGLWAFEADGSLLPGFPKPTHAPGTPFSQPAVGDLDGDGLQEVVWLGESGEIVVWNVPGTPGSPHHEWPMVRQNAAHTGALP